MKYLKRTIGFLVLGLVIIVCGANLLHKTSRPSPEIKSIMDRKIDEFHQKLVQHKFAEVYAESDSKLKSKFSEQEFIDYLQKANEKLGNQLPKANVDSQESLANTIGRKLGRTVFQHQSIKIFEKPDYRSELFTWAIHSNDDVKLSSYVIFYND